MGTLFLELKNKNIKTNTTTALAEWETENVDGRVSFICPKCKSKMGYESKKSKEFEPFLEMFRSFNFCPNCGQDLR
jgi:predicted RNA-binding Zn-ribbon protein involved in translation (DUF1610 family)